MFLFMFKKFDTNKIKIRKIFSRGIYYCRTSLTLLTVVSKGLIDWEEKVSSKFFSIDQPLREAAKKVLFLKGGGRLNGCAT